MKDLASIEVSKELNVEKVESDMCQGDKVGTSDVGELTRSRDTVKLHAHSLFSCHAMLVFKSH